MLFLKNFFLTLSQTTPHASRHELSKEVHRVGYHFPTDIVAKVCSHYGIHLTSSGRVINDQNNGQIVMRVYQKGQLVLDEKVQDQIQINTDAKETIKDLFPNIPDNDLFQIIKTAFQLGDGKVGTADEIPLIRRAQLSVVAHIRHTYTSYDKLLRRMQYNVARHEVEGDTLKKLVEWRGNDDSKDDDARKRAVDDLVREVIVVSDEDDSDDDGDDAEQIRQDELRVEELPSDSYGPPPYRPLSPTRNLMYEEAPAGYRIVPQYARRERLPAADLDAQDRNRRAMIWENARQAYRTRVPEPEPLYQRVYSGRSSPVRTLVPLDPPTGNVIRREYLGPAPNQSSFGYEVGYLTEASSSHLPMHSSTTSCPVKATDTRQALPLSRPISPRYSGQMTDGQRVERIPIDPEPVSYRRRTPPLQYSAGRPRTPIATHGLQRRRSASPDVGRGSVLPSIEGPNGHYSPTQGRQHPAEQTRTWPTPPSNFAPRHSQQFKEPAIIDLTSSQDSTSRTYRQEGEPRNPFQPRPDQQSFTENMRSAYANHSIQPYPERRLIEVDPPRASTGDALPRDPRHGPDARYRELHDVDRVGTRRVLIPEDDLGFRNASNDSYRRSNLIDAQSARSEYRLLQPLPSSSGEYSRAEPRRILEPLPIEQLPVRYYPQDAYEAPLERRIVYTAPPPGQVPDQR